MELQAVGMFVHEMTEKVRFLIKVGVAGLTIIHAISFADLDSHCFVTIMLSTFEAFFNSQQLIVVIDTLDSLLWEFELMGLFFDRVILIRLIFNNLTFNIL